MPGGKMCREVKLAHELLHIREILVNCFNDKTFGMKQSPHLIFEDSYSRMVLENIPRDIEKYVQ